MEEVVEIPDDIQVTVIDRKIVVKGAKGALEKDFDDPRFNALMSLHVHDGKFTAKSDDESRKVHAMVNTVCAHVDNMIRGVRNGYKYILRVVYTHFPMTITVEKNEVHIKNFVGEKGARVAKIKGNTEVKAEKEIITISGTNIEDVGQTAANIERACKLRGRDRRTFQDGIYIESKHLQTGEVI